MIGLIIMFEPTLHNVPVVKPFWKSAIDYCDSETINVASNFATNRNL